MKKNKPKSNKSVDLRIPKEKAMRATNISRETLLHNIQAAVVIHGADTKIIACNTAAQELIGLTEKQMKGKGIEYPDWNYLYEDRSVIPTENYPVHQVLAKQKAVKDLIIGISRPRKKEIQWLLVNANPIVDHEGSISHVIVTFMDITKRKRFEDTLRKSEEKFKNLFNNAQVGLFRTRISDGKILECNTQLAKLLGYKNPQECIAEFVAAQHYTDPSIRKKMTTEIKKIGKIRNFEAQITRRDGSPIWLSYSANFYPERKSIEGVAVDIDEHKKAVEELEKSEERYRTIFNNAAVSIWEKDFSRAKEIIDELKAQGITDFRTYLNEHPEVVREAALASKTLDVNDMTLKLYGAKTKEDLLVPTGTRLVDESLELLRECMIASAEGKTYYYGETINRTVDGRQVNVLIYVNIPVEKEQFKRVLLTVTDITKRKKAELETEESREYAESVIRTIREPFIVIDAEQQVVSASSSFYRNFRMRPEEVEGKSLYDLGNHEWDIPKLRELLVDILPKNTTFDNFEVKLNFKELGYRTLLLNARQIYLETRGIRLILLAIEDITERKKAEEEIIRLAKFPSESPYPVLRVTKDGTILYANDASKLLLRFWDCKTKQRIPSHYHKFIRDALKSASSKKAEVEFNSYILSLTFAPVVVANYVNIYGYDITTRKRAAEALKKAHDELEQRVQERTAELAKANEELWAEIAERKRAKEELQLNYDIQRLINTILNLSHENISLEEILKRFLNVLLAIPWFSFESRGGIFLVDKNDPNVLLMTTHLGLPAPLRKECKRIPFGKCLCGQAALTRKIQFTDRLDDHHKILYKRMTPHGHYCIPIVSSNQTLGVICLYIKEGYNPNQKEIEFLNAITTTLSGIILRRRMEEALNKSESRYRDVSELVSDWAYAYRLGSEDLMVREWVTEAFTRITGYPSSKLDKHSGWQSIVHPDDQAIVEKRLKDLYDGKSNVSEYRIITEDGETRWIRDYGRAVLHKAKNKVVRIYGAAQDITIRKKAEEALLQEQSKLTIMLEQKSLLANIAAQLNSAESFYDITDQILETIASAMGIEHICMLRLDSQNEQKVDISILSEVSSLSMTKDCFKDSIPIISRIVEKLRDGEYFIASDFSDFDKEVRNFLIARNIGLVCILPITIASRVKGYIGICKSSKGDWGPEYFNFFQTITDMIASAWARHNDLEARLKAEMKQTEAIQMAERASRLASIGVISGGITHEINQPLSAIKITTDSVLFWDKNNKGILPEKFVDHLQKISLSVDRINEIIRHMRLFWVSPQQIEKKTVDLNKVITNALSLVDRQLHSHGIKPEKKLCDHALFVEGNHVHLEQIVLNLVVNAMNSLDLTERKLKKINVITQQKNKTAIIKVTDNGTGLPEGTRDEIFDPFFSTRKPGEGMGLGLAIVKRFVDQHGGVISARNNPAGGTSFAIQFPLSPVSKETSNGHTSG